MRVRTESEQTWDIDLAGRRVRSFNQKGETDGWDCYQECSIPSVGSQVYVTLEPGLVLTIDRLKEIEQVSEPDRKFLTEFSESLKNTNGGC